MEKAKKNQPKPELDNFRSNLEWGSSRRNYLQATGRHARHHHRHHLHLTTSTLPLPLQVAAADAVYAVAARSNPDKFGPGDHRPKVDVVGGTGWACQFYIDRFEPRGAEAAAGCHLYFYDDGRRVRRPTRTPPPTANGASGTRGGEGAALPEGALPPKPTGVYAAAGMTRLNAGHGDVAFEKVMAQ